MVGQFYVEMTVEDWYQVVVRRPFVHRGDLHVIPVGDFSITHEWIGNYQAIST